MSQHLKARALEMAQRIDKQRDPHNGATHFDECWRIHDACALRRIADALPATEAPAPCPACATKDATIAERTHERDVERIRFAHYSNQFAVLVADIGRLGGGEWGHLRYRIIAELTSASTQFTKYAAGQSSPSNFRKRAEAAEAECLRLRDQLAALSSQETPRI